MQYYYTKNNQDYSDYSSGRVFYNSPGYSAFPVRLAIELFLRSYKQLKNETGRDTFSIYDPFCGGCYLLGILGLTQGKFIQSIHGSDASDKALQLGSKNLNLLSLNGMSNRVNEIQELVLKFNKESHQESLKSAIKIENQLKNQLILPSVQLFRHNILNSQNSEIIHPVKYDMIITDLPYGQLTDWVIPNEKGFENIDFIDQFLKNVESHLFSHSLLTIVSNKTQKITYKRYRKIKKINLGHRMITILRKN